MRDLLLSTFFDYPVVVLSELLLAVILSRRRVRHRVIIVLGSYFVFLGAALAVAFFGRDEFGFRFIPALLLTWPWSNLVANLAWPNFWPQLAVGAALNIGLLLVVDRLSYPKHAPRVVGQRAT